MEYLELWGIMITVLIFSLYYIIGRCIGKIYILGKMLYAEKNTLKLGLYSEKEKMQHTLDQYDGLPALVRIVISKDIYEGLILQFDAETNISVKPPIDN